MDFNDFLGYASHQSQIEEIIAAGVELAREGGGSVILDIPDDFSESEIEYIQERIEREM